MHLLACDRCGARLREVIALAEGIRNLAREGSLRLVVSDAFVLRAAEQGLLVRQYAPPPGGGVECTVTAEDDILIARLAANLSGAKRVDLSCAMSAASNSAGCRIFHCRRREQRVYQESITFAKAMPTGTLIARLVTFDEAGSERLLGEYTFNHTRSRPGTSA